MLLSASPRGRDQMTLELATYAILGVAAVIVLIRNIFAA
jgi:hypothetical protein